MSASPTHLLQLLQSSASVGLPGEVPNPLETVLSRAEVLGRLVHDAAGVKPGDRALLCDPDPGGFLLGLLALLRLDAVPVPVDPRAGSALLAAVLEQARPAAALVGGGAPASLAAALAGATPLLDIPAGGKPPDIGPLPGLPPVIRGGDDEALVIFTSGSTGLPKGVVLTHANLAASLAAISAYLPLDATPHSALLLPLHYGYALIGQLLCTLAAGGRVSFLSPLRFPAAMVDALASLGPCGLSSVPASLGLLCDVAEEDGLELTDVEYLGSAGARLPAALIPRLRRVFPAARLFNQYGCTEAAPRVSYIEYGAHRERFEGGCVGQAVDGLELAVLRPDGAPAPDGEEGDVAIRGPSLSPGYLGEAPGEATNRRSDHLLTGDVGRLEDGGWLYLAGRRDRLVKVAGERVSLDEVEAALLRHPSVRDAAAAALPHDKLGNLLAAAVVGQEQAMPALEAHLLGELGMARRPARLVYVEQIPRTSSDKTDREALERLIKEKTR